MPGSIQSIERAAAVLRMLGAAAAPVALSDIARALDLPKATVHGIVTTLCSLGFVAQDASTGRYLLGEGLSTLRAGTDPHELRSAAMNWSDQLAARTGLEVHVGVPSPEGVLLVHHVFRPDDSVQALRIGETQPLHATALGKVLLAHVAGTQGVASLTLDRYTVRTCVDPVALVRQLEHVRSVGHAVEGGELEAATASIAAPVRRIGGLAVGAIAVVGPFDRLLSPRGEPQRALVEHTVAAARSVTHQLADPR